jgi:hypothetical protein
MVRNLENPVEQTIYLADNEWQSDGSMERVAREAFANDPELTLVSVCEHGGWWLQYVMDDDRLLIIGTANDLAKFSPEQMEIKQKLRASKWTYRECIRRQNSSQ